MTKSKASIALSVALVTAMAVILPAMAQIRSTTRATPVTPPAAYDIQTIARDLSDKAQDACNLASNQRSRTPVELYVALCGFAGSAKAYAQMAADQREEAGLQNAARTLVSHAKEIDGLFGSAGATDFYQPWRLVQDKVSLLNNAYPAGYGYRSGTRDAASLPSRTRTRDTAPVTPSATSAAAATSTSGRFHWQGRVDGSDYIMLQGSQVTVSHIEGAYISDATYSLQVPLPQQALQLKLTKVRGRGNVEIVREPTADNKYTLAVLVEDPRSGADLYEFEVAW